MLPEYKTILYATDLSPNAARAFRHAASVALHYGGRIHILHVLPEGEQAVVNVLSTAMGEDRYAELELEHHDELVAEIRTRLGTFATEELAGRDPTCVAEIEIVHGDPAAEIVAAAERVDADLVVLGSHGRGWLRHVLLGSVAHQVLTRSRRPVFVSRLLDQREGAR